MVSLNTHTRGISRLDLLKLTPEEQERIIRQGNLYDESIFTSASNQEEDYARYLAGAGNSQETEQPEETEASVLDEIYNDEELVDIATKELETFFEEMQHVRMTEKQYQAMIEDQKYTHTVIATTSYIFPKVDAPSLMPNWEKDTPDGELP